MEEQATIPEEIQELGEEVQEATPAEGTEEIQEEITEEEQNQVDLVAALTKSGSIPKGVEPFQDEDGTVKFVMPINGQKYIVNFNQLLSGFNLNQAGEQKLREGKAMEAGLKAELAKMSPDNPNGKKEIKKFLVKLGYDPAEISEALLQEAVEEQQMTPEEKAYRAKLADIEERERKLEEAQMTAKQKEEHETKVKLQQKFTNEALTTLETRLKDKELQDPELKKYLLTGIFGKMKEAIQIGHRISADEAYERLMLDTALVVRNASKLYSKAHLKHMIPSEFKKLVMGMSLEDKDLPLVANSVRGGAVELENYEDTRVKKPKKKIPLSEWVPKI